MVVILNKKRCLLVKICKRSTLISEEFQGLLTGVKMKRLSNKEFFSLYES